jgi:hypothetical protein
MQRKRVAPEKKTADDEDMVQLQNLNKEVLPVKKKAKKEMMTPEQVSILAQVRNMAERDSMFREGLFKLVSEAKSG